MFLCIWVYEYYIQTDRQTELLLEVLSDLKITVTHYILILIQGHCDSRFVLNDVEQCEENTGDGDDGIIDKIDT